MRGKNPIRPPARGDGSTLDVARIFPTLQGEGPYTGCPSVFVRLGGCNLACAFCDTEFEQFETMGIDAILEEIKQASCTPPAPLAEGEGIQLRIRPLVVITGGEPLRQPIAPLCEALIERKFKVQIETNGTLWRDLPPEVEIVCSPKNTGQGYYPLRDDLLKRVSALKYLISAHDPLYREVGASPAHIPVYVQPMDEYDAGRNADNLARAKDLALTRGYRLSLQTHKILGIE